MYASRDNYKGVAKVTSSFKFTLQSGFYASFYDDQRTAWSLHFESASDLENIAKQIGIARGSQGESSSVIVQDLLLGEGQEVSKDDSVDTKYAGYLFKDGSLGKVREEISDCILA